MSVVPNLPSRQPCSEGMICSMPIDTIRYISINIFVYTHSCNACSKGPRLQVQKLTPSIPKSTTNVVVTISLHLLSFPTRLRLNCDPYHLPLQGFPTITYLLQLTNRVYEVYKNNIKHFGVYLFWQKRAQV